MSGVSPAVISGIVTLVVAGAGIAATALSQRNEYTRKIREEKDRRKQELKFQEQRLRIELENSIKLQEERIRMEMRTVFMAEEAIRDLLKQESYREGRKFETIKRTVGGWDKDEDELRRILVRCGAVRFYRRSDNAELWGLRSRVSNELQEPETD
jgi:hypothetical protein